MGSPPRPRGHPHLRIRLKARQCRRLDRIAEDCAAGCTCDNRRVQCAVGSIVSLCRGSAKLEDGPSCMDAGLRGNRGRWRAHTAICASDPVWSLRKANLLLQCPLTIVSARRYWMARAQTYSRFLVTAFFS